MDIVFTKNTLWLSKENICSLFGISKERLDYELMKIFSDNIFSKKENRERFIFGEKGKVIECFRLGVIISLGYRIHATEGTKYIIQTNRIIKKKFSKNKTKRYIKKEKKIEKINEDMGLLTQALDLIKNFEGVRKRQRIFA